MQDGSAQAQSNLKFLSTLKGPCEDLAQAQPKEIPAMLTQILNIIRMIWINSEHYKSRERLTGLLRKVGNFHLKGITAESGNLLPTKKSRTPSYKDVLLSDPFCLKPDVQSPEGNSVIFCRTRTSLTAFQNLEKFSEKFVKSS